MPCPGSWPLQFVAQEPVLQGSQLTRPVRAAAIELPRGLRINAVSPGLLVESVDQLGEFFRGFEPVPGARVALGYARSVEGADTGKVYAIR